MAKKPWSEERQAALRSAMFLWLDEKMRVRGGGELARTDLNDFSFKGERIQLVDRQGGIWNPWQLSSTFSILETVKGREKYKDERDEDWVTYSYAEGDGGKNTKLGLAHERQDPLIYFMPVRDGLYLPYFPIYLAENDKARRVVHFSLDPEHGPNPIADSILDPLAHIPKRYQRVQTLRRVHQPVFRQRVLAAYRSRCAICQLGWAELLDAAHIIRDSFENGLPEVSNGMALCKLHHAAYDTNLLGIDEAYGVTLSKRAAGRAGSARLLLPDSCQKIVVPPETHLQPAKGHLAERFEEFLRTDRLSE